MKRTRLPDASNIRLPIQLKDRLQRIAAANSLSMSDIVRILLVTKLPDVEAGSVTLRGADGLEEVKR